MKRDTMFDNPYVGLKPFDIDDSLLFFGRKAQTTELLNKLHKTRFLGVIGKSGCGKSSLIRAGLIPHLKAGFLLESRRQWQIIIMKPGNNPLSGLAEAIYETFSSHFDPPELNIPDIVSTIKKAGTRGVLECIHTLDKEKNTNTLLLVDQFEEIFEFYKQAKTAALREEAQRFVSTMLGLCDQKVIPIYTVITMRSDFLGDCDHFFGLPEAMNKSQYLVPRMTRDKRMEAIKGPAALLGVKPTSRLMQRLLNDSSDNPDHLPVLQHAMMRTWDKWKQTEDPDPDSIHYEEIGSMTQALSNHANEIYNQLNENQQTIAERIFKAITNKETDGRGIRRPTLLKDLFKIVDDSPDQIKYVIDQFRQPGCTFVFPHHLEKLEDDHEINITHESLMRVWDKLIKWVDEEAESARRYKRLVESALLMKKGDSGFSGFLNDVELTMINDWKEKQNPNGDWAIRYHTDFDIAIDYLEQSMNEAEQRQKQEEIAKQQKQDFEKAQERASFQRKITMTIAFFLCIALALAGFSGVQYYKADQARKDTEQQKRIADEKRNEAEEARKLAEKERQIAEKERQEAIKQKNIAEERFAKITKLQDTLVPLAAKQGRLYIKTIPSDASIQIKGIDSEYSDGMKLNEGVYQITVSHEDYFPKTTKWTIQAGKENNFTTKLKPKPCEITVLGEPDNATIFVNSINKGQSKLVLKKLEPGNYFIKVEKDGYDSFEKAVSIGANQKEKVAYQLVKFAQLTVICQPEDSLIRIMNIKPKYVPGIALLPGEYHINITKQGYEKYDEKIHLNEGELKKLEVELSSLLGEIHIQVAPKDAEIFVNSIKKGIGNVSLTNLKPDKYTIRLKKKGYQAYEEEILLKASQTFQKGYQLQKEIKPKVIKSKVITNKIGMTFVYIPPGSFMMGSPKDEPGRYDRENQHEVVLTKGYYMQTTEVTQGQWKSVMGENPSKFKDCGDNCPVEWVSWKDVQVFIEKMNKKADKYLYRLPTEAEWEYAARAGTKGPFAFGDCLSTEDANYNGYPLSNCPKGEYRRKTIPVATLKANKWGLYDMHGNVYEWCSDWYGDYPTNRVVDPQGAQSGTYRLKRGGSWLSSARYCRSAFRDRDEPGGRGNFVGVRLAVSLSSASSE